MDSRLSVVIVLTLLVLGILSILTDNATLTNLFLSVFSYHG